MAYTKDILLNLSRKLLSIKNKNIDLTTGTVLEDLGVEAQAQILSLISEDIDRVKNQQSLNPEYFTDAEADELVKPFNITRNQATKATGSVTFASSTQPSASSPILIPLGTRISGSNGTSTFYYVTTTEGSITSSSPFNSQTGYYETTVGIEAVSPGTSSNLGIGYINQMSSSISGVSAIYNKNAIVNGSDIETTADLLNRYTLMWRGRNRNTESGILAWTYTNPQVKEAIVVGPNSEYTLRGPGAVDVYVRGSAATQFTQTVTKMTKEVYLTQCPVIDPTNNIVVTVNGVSYYESDNYFTFVKDTETIFQNSVSAKDKLVWTEAGYEIIKNQDSYTISYTYDSTVSALQAMYDNDEERLITGDLLARSTTQVNIIMEFGINVYSGYDKNATISLVKTNIQNFVNTLPLNTTVRESDIVAIVEGTTGVNYTNLPFLQFHVYGEEDPNKLVADIEASPLEYFRVDADDIIVG